MPSIAENFFASYFGHAHLWQRWKKSLCLFFCI